MCNCVICGHIHQPQKKIIETAKGKVTYLNSGDWVEHMTTLEYNKKEWVIYTYDELLLKQNNRIDVKKDLNVMTDQISFYIHSLTG